MDRIRLIPKKVALPVSHILMALVLMHCSWLPSQRALKQCRFEPTGYQFTGMDKEGLHGILDIRATNPGASIAKLHRMKLWILHSADTLAQIQLDTLVELKGATQLNLPLAMVMPYKALPKLAGPLAKGSQLECQIIGDAWIHTPFGTYTARNALKKSMIVDLSQASNAIYQGLGVPWLKNWIP